MHCLAEEFYDVSLSSQATNLVLYVVIWKHSTQKGGGNYFKMFVYFRVPTVPRSGDDYLFMGHDSQKLIDCIVQLEREVQTAFMQKNRFVL